MDDFIVGFQHQDDAERFLGELRGRLAKFNLELHPEKTRLIEFGPRAAWNRKARGEGKPETFTFLGFRHIARMTRQGRFWAQRITDKKKMAAKLKQVKAELMRRRHLSVPEQGRWLASVIRGHEAYYAVPGNAEAVAAFRYYTTRHWRFALSRRSQTSRVTWERTSRLARRYLPMTKIRHPWPERGSQPGTHDRSPVRESRSLGSARGAARKDGPYRDYQTSRLSGSVTPGIKTTVPVAAAIAPLRMSASRVPMAATTAPSMIVPRGIRARENSQSTEETRPRMSPGVSFCISGVQIMFPYVTNPQVIPANTADIHITGESPTHTVDIPAAAQDVHITATLRAGAGRRAVNREASAPPLPLAAYMTPSHTGPA